MALLKTTSLGERFKVQFRAEAYNVFNHRNFSIGLPTNNGSIDSTTNPNPIEHRVSVRHRRVAVPQ
jgi:hypothetical protein